MIFPEQVFEKLVEHHVVTPGPLATPCWVWSKGCCNKGYGFVYFYDPNTPATGKGRTGGKSRGVRAHIASWVIANGPVPAGMTLDHLCRNTRCMRPSHLEPVTRPENTRRGNAVRVYKRHTARSTSVSFGTGRSRGRSRERRQQSTK